MQTRKIGSFKDLLQDDEERAEIIHRGSLASFTLHKGLGEVLIDTGDYTINVPEDTKIKYTHQAFTFEHKNYPDYIWTLCGLSDTLRVTWSGEEFSIIPQED